MKVFIAVVLSLMFLVPLPAMAADQSELLNKIDELTKELESLKQQVQELKENDEKKEERIVAVEQASEEANKPPVVELSGDYRFRYDYLNGHVADYFRFEDVLGSMFGGPAPQLQEGFDVKNDSLLTNRFGLNIKARATEDIQVKARLLMYKVWGHQTAEPVTGANAFFADRASVFDGNVSHVPEDSILRVDQAYATWSNVFGLPAWFSVGRRPSTGGIPTNLRQNKERTGTAGSPGLLVDYAFDGLTLGVAPEIEALPGAFAKICYGRGFDSGFRQTNNTMKDVDMIGVNVTPYATEDLNVQLQWNRGINMFAFPESSTSNVFGTNKNLGDIDQFGGVVTGKFGDVGPGDLNVFASAAASITHPNDNLVEVSTPAGPMGVAGLLYDAPALGGKKESKAGYGLYLGARYDINPTLTKVGVEYNHGSKDWITFTPASDDIWTSKLGARGNVYEVYLIQGLNQKPILKYGKAYFRLGYQYYQFDYTGSSNWVGAPKKISELNDPANAQMFAPIKNAQDLYLTFDVEF